VSKTSRAKSSSAPLASPSGLDVSKFENVLQVGGIRTGTLDGPSPGQPVRVALFDTGSGLRFTVALDRGGDIIDAFYNASSLAYLSPVGLRPPTNISHPGLRWLSNWPAGLLTTCGPLHMGWPIETSPITASLHGNFSNQAATLLSIVNPDPHRSKLDMSITLEIRDAHMFGPSIQIIRTISCTLGQSTIRLSDEVTNRGNTVAPHHWLYHVNLGYPLLDDGARLVYRGKSELAWAQGQPFDLSPKDRTLEALKTVVAPLAEHVGSGERGTVVRVEPGKDGLCRTGLVNKKRKLGFELAYSPKQLPRTANWQHYGPNGSYVTGIEPFAGSLMGKGRDPYLPEDATLAPGQSKRYDLTLSVLTTTEELSSLLSQDGKVTAVK
jgi:hypothetical protein